MAHPSNGNERTTIEVKKDTHRQLEEIKPFDSMSFDELVRHLADTYSETEGVDDGW